MSSGFLQSSIFKTLLNLFLVSDLRPHLQPRHLPFSDGGMNTFQSALQFAPGYLPRSFRPQYHYSELQTCAVVMQKENKTYLPAIL